MSPDWGNGMSLLVEHLYSKFGLFKMHVTLGQWKRRREPPLTDPSNIPITPLSSGTQNEPKPKLLSPYIFRWGGGLPLEGVGAKKFGMSLEFKMHVTL